MHITAHKAYINDIALNFVNIYDAKALTTPEGKIVSSAKTDVKDIIKEIERKPAAETYYYLSDNPDSSWLLFLSYFTLVEASGGLVQNDKGEYLVIFRRGKWDLPKGKIDYDESPEEAGMREVEEECGVKGLEIVKPLPVTFHTYRLKGRESLKKTHWYLMTCDSTGKLVPQADEDIEKAEWMNAKKIQTIFFGNTYRSMKDFLSLAIDN